MPYTTHGYIMAWAKAGFGTFIAVMLWLIFDSLFLGLLTFAFLAFVPLQDEQVERKFNGIGFSVVMFLVLFMAFTNWFGGLGLDLGITKGWILGGWGLLFLMGVAIFVRGVVYSFPPRSPLIARMSTPLGKTILNFLIFLLFFLAVITMQPWNWTITAIIFVSIWLISFATGASGDIETKQGIGVFVIAISFIIFTAGVGTQEVGQAAFGQWWPTVYEFTASTFGPIGNVFSQLSGTLDQTITLITCPTCFAQTIMEGNYQRDDKTGETGALGVEIERFEITPIYPYQMYQVIFEIKNKGAFDAEDVYISLTTGSESAKLERAAPSVGTRKEISIEELGFIEGEDAICTKEENGKCGRLTKNITAEGKEMQSGDIEQVLFTTAESGIICPVINSYQLREKNIPFKAIVNYKYEIASEIDLEFISSEEWHKKALEGTLETGKKERTTYKNAPVRLDIDAMEQPVKEGLTYLIGVQLISNQKNGRITEIKEVMLEYPKELGEPINNDRCPVTEGERFNTIKWDGETFPKSQVIYCQFPPLRFESFEIKGPTKTYHLKANATYLFENEKVRPSKMEFGGGCCNDKECGKERQCTWEEGMDFTGQCLVEGTEETTEYKPGGKKYCSGRAEREGIKCNVGMGGCQSDADCCQVTSECADEGLADLNDDGKSDSLKCRKNILNGVCCPENELLTDDLCKEMHEKWVRGEITLPEIKTTISDYILKNRQD
jgi:hypothetical protein